MPRLPAAAYATILSLLCIAVLNSVLANYFTNTKEELRYFKRKDVSNTIAAAGNTVTTNANVMAVVEIGTAPADVNSIRHADHDNKNDDNPSSDSSAQAEKSGSTDALVYHTDGAGVNTNATDTELRNISKPFCQPHQLFPGKWVKQELPQPPYQAFPKKNCPSTVPWIDYEWIPTDNSCEFGPWFGNQQLFCDVMKDAVILLVGDSLTWEHYSSLIESNGVFSSPNLQMRSLYNHRTIIQAVCQNKTTHVAFRRDDSLKGLGQYIQETFPVVLIVNRGAHYVNDEILLPEIRQSFQEVNQWQAQCKQLGLKCHFFWRTTFPGHPDCSNFTEPVNDLAAMEAWIDTIRPEVKGTPFNWHFFKHQNELVLKELENSGIEDYHVIDSYHLNILRPDRHAKPNNNQDCLHSCSPGKMDVYNQFLLHFLRRERTLEDVETLTAATNYPWNRSENVRLTSAGILDLIWDR